MPEIIPFRGVRYNQGLVHLDEVVAPPYDVISPEQQQELYERNPHNVVRLILGREEDRYGAAAKRLKEWMGQSILTRDEKLALYVLWQTFNVGDSRSVTRKGFIALCRLEEFDARVILPHEKTLAKPREDRFRLFKATHSNFSQVFSLYSDPEHEIDRVLNGRAKSAPVADVVFEDVQNRLWETRDAETIGRVQHLMKPKQVVIADGHHRYETALAYRDRLRSQNPNHHGRELYNYVMMFFTNVDDDGLVIFPTHRVVHSLESFDPKSFLQKLESVFVLREYKDRESLITALGVSPVRSFGLTMRGVQGLYLLSLKPTISVNDLVADDQPREVKDLDVTVLHAAVLRGILGISYEAQEQKRHLGYVREASEACEMVSNGQAQLAFLMNPTRIQEVRSVAKAGHTMPQKSTYFYPKLPSGLVLNIMSE
jgi:uncharacterized protein (DUF1015 family)